MEREEWDKGGCVWSCLMGLNSRSGGVAKS